MRSPSHPNPQPHPNRVRFCVNIKSKTLRQLVTRKKQPPKQEKQQKLTDKEERFCQEYAVCLNGALAARRAGYSANSAREIAHENLSKPHIRARLQEIADLTPAKIVNELVSIAIARITDVSKITASNELEVQPSDKWSDRAKAAVKTIKFTKTVYRDKEVNTTEVTMHDKQKALVEVMRLFKLYPSDMKLLEAVNLLLAEGVLSEEHARIVQDGIQSIEDRLKGKVAEDGESGEEE